MNNESTLNFTKAVLKNMPEDWLKLTTHRLDIYNEKLAKVQFLEQFDSLMKANNPEVNTLSQLPTAYDYIRLGHPLSSILEWAIANNNGLSAENVISFSSRSIPILAILRKNLLDHKSTLILHTEPMPDYFDVAAIQVVYGYNFELKSINKGEDIPSYEGSTVLVAQGDKMGAVNIPDGVDFLVSIHNGLGSVLLINGAKNEAYISAIQHVRRRETIAMTPADCYTALQELTGEPVNNRQYDRQQSEQSVLEAIKGITDTRVKPLVGSSGLSMQYAIMMGLIDHAIKNHPGKAIKIIVPPNCYGGTNDQARRVAACLENVEVVDLPVDREHNMDESTDRVLDKVAREDAVPIIIAEIPTNPRVEVPDLEKLKAALSKARITPSGEAAIPPVFILDQTFCPNYNFLGEDEILSSVRTLAYVSGSKFPSGGRCTAGYCVANDKAVGLMDPIEKHLKICNNQATDLQMAILAEQLPSMNQRIADAYANTRAFVNFIEEVLPEAKINFVSEELAEKGFTPSVFSLDLPTKGDTPEERENYKRELNNRLINLMIKEIPNESKYCVSYGQLKGCYWTIPATSTQGTTKEDDKDYIARVSLSPDMDLELHKKVFADFVESI